MWEDSIDVQAPGSRYNGTQLILRGQRGIVGRDQTIVSDVESRKTGGLRVDVERMNVGRTTGEGLIIL